MPSPQVMPLESTMPEATLSSIPILDAPPETLTVRTLAHIAEVRRRHPEAHLIWISPKLCAVMAAHPGPYPDPKSDDRLAYGSSGEAAWSTAAEFTRREREQAVRVAERAHSGSPHLLFFAIVAVAAALLCALLGIIVTP